MIAREVRSGRSDFFSAVNLEYTAAPALFSYVRHEEPSRVAYCEIERLGFLDDGSSNGREGGHGDECAIGRLLYYRSKYRYPASSLPTWMHGIFWPVLLFSLDIRNVCTCRR